MHSMVDAGHRCQWVCPPVPGSCMAILLYVDDEEAIGRAVSRWFQRRGHEVHLATSVAAAQEQLAEVNPDVVFLDVWLGQESGFELMDWIEETRPELSDRITFVTGELAGPERSNGLARTLGRPVLQKPFDFAALEAIADGADGPPGAAETRSGM